MGSRELEARMLTAEDNGRLASLGPRCMFIAAVGGVHWCPKALEKQHLRRSKASVLWDMRLGD